MIVMKSAMCLMVLALGLVGCGGSTDGADGDDECQEALDKLEECDITVFGIDEQAASECNSQSECVAVCVNDGSCTDIRAAVNGTANSVATCVNDCI